MRVSYVLLPAMLTAALPAMASETVNVAPFRSIELRDGGEIVVRAGTTQRVTLIEGSRRYTHFDVDGEGRLLVQTSCNGDCPHHYALHVEIVMPRIAGLAVSDGGSIRTDGAIRQDFIAAAVREGGLIDIRSLSADNVTAAVNEGGKILVTANHALTAAVREGGNITYWGNPSSITKAVHDGGAVEPAGGEQQGALAPHHAVREITLVAANAGDDESAGNDENDDSDMNDNDDSDGSDMNDNDDEFDMNDSEDMNDDGADNGDDGNVDQPDQPDQPDQSGNNDPGGY